MRAVLNERALGDLQNIHEWISDRRPETARMVAERLFAAIDKLALFPLMGRMGAVAGTRELVVPRLPYTIVYRLDAAADILVVIAIFHDAQSR